MKTIYSENAELVATRDRERTADLILSLAVSEAIDSIRQGRTGYARFRMVRAGMAAERILGRGGAS